MRISHKGNYYKTNFLDAQSRQVVSDLNAKAGQA